jgi:hypothetical protein
MSDYETQLQAWLSKQGLKSVDEAQGKPREATAEFIQPESEMDGVLCVWVEGEHAIMSDSYGYNERFNKAELKAWVDKHGRLKDWDDFAKLGQEGPRGESTRQPEDD